MSFYAIGEPAYEPSDWYRHIINGLVNEKRQKRFTLILLNEIEELKSFSIDNDDAIFVIGTNAQWLENIITVCEPYFDNRIIVLSNHQRRLYGRKYSIVTADITRDIKVLYTYLKFHGKSRIAMYGINPKSAADLFKRESFLSCDESEESIFYNRTSLLQCFEDFKSQIDNFDGVICVNDYTAISLIKHLDRGAKLFVTSCNGSLLGSSFTPSITNTRINYEGFGKAGLDLCRILQKNSLVNSVNIHISSSFITGETTDFLPLPDFCKNEVVSVEKSRDTFYDDFEIDEMLKIETMLNACTSDDLLIIKRVLEGKVYSDIADELYMSANGIKYKLKNMFKQCGAASKNEFVNILSKYIEPSHL